MHTRNSSNVSSFVEYRLTSREMDDDQLLCSMYFVRAEKRSNWNEGEGQ